MGALSHDILVWRAERVRNIVGLAEHLRLQHRQYIKMRFYDAREKIARHYDRRRRLFSSSPSNHPISLYSEHPRSSFSFNTSSSFSVTSASSPLLPTPFSPAVDRFFFRRFSFFFLMSRRFGGSFTLRGIYCLDLSTPMGAGGTAAWPFIVI